MSVRGYFLCSNDNRPGFAVSLETPIGFSPWLMRGRNWSWATCLMLPH